MENIKRDDLVKILKCQRRRDFADGFMFFIIPWSCLPGLMLLFIPVCLICGTPLVDMILTVLLFELMGLVLAIGMAVLNAADWNYVIRKIKKGKPITESDIQILKEEGHDTNIIMSNQESKREFSPIQ